MLLSRLLGFRGSSKTASWVPAARWRTWHADVFLFGWCGAVMIAGGQGCAADQSQDNTTWTECPPMGAAPGGGMVTETTYAGQSCAGALSCSWYYADCPDLGGVGTSCSCVDGKFECQHDGCSSNDGTGGAAGAANAGSLAGASGTAGTGGQAN